MTTEKPQEKTTKTVPAPRLRFKQFEGQGEWEEKPLREIASLITRRAGKETHTPMSITSGVGLVSQVEKFGREIAGAQYKNYYVLEQNDFAYNKSATKEYPEGFLTMHTLEQTGAVPNSIFTCFRADNEQAIPEYLNYLFQGNLHGRWLRKFISVGARANGALTVEASDLMSTPVPLPCGETTLQEQQHIAATLSSLDDLITAHTDKLEALRQHKRGLMQGLFPAEGERVPRLRFSEFVEAGEWEEKTIGQISQTFSGGTPSTSKADYYGGEIPFIRSAEISSVATELRITHEGLKKSSAKMVNKGDLLLALYGANSGDVGISKIDGAINQAILCIRPKINTYLLFSFWKHKKDKMISSYIQGGQGNLSAEIVKSIKVAYPEPDEQQYIADCLSSLDDLITAQADKIVALQEFKRGLMQGLFPSTTAAAQEATE